MEISTSSQSPVEVKMIDLLGKQVYANSFHDIQDNGSKRLSFAEQLKGGVYFLIASQNGKIVNQKVVIRD